MTGIEVQYRIQFPKFIRYPVLPKSHFLAQINNVLSMFWYDCRRIQYRPSPYIDIVLPVNLFVLYGYPLRRGGQYRQPSPTLGRAVTNAWRISMARSIVGNRDTSGSDQQPMYDRLLRPTIDRRVWRSIVTSCDAAYDQPLHPATDRTNNRGGRGPTVRSFVADGDRWYDQSLHPSIDRTRNRFIL